MIVFCVGDFPLWLAFNGGPFIINSETLMTDWQLCFSRENWHVSYMVIGEDSNLAFYYGLSMSGFWRFCCEALNFLQHTVFQSLPRTHRPGCRHFWNKERQRLKFVSLSRVQTCTLSSGFHCVFSSSLFGAIFVICYSESLLIPLDDGVERWGQPFIGCAVCKYLL